MNIRSMHRSLRLRAAWRLGVCLVVLMLCGRFAVPAGYMPTVQDGGGELVLTLCSGQPLPQWLAHPASEDPGDANGQDLPPCPFGVLGAQGVLPDAEPAPLLRLVLAALEVSPPAYRPLPALPATGPPLGSRAPPLSA